MDIKGNKLKERKTVSKFTNQTYPIFLFLFVFPLHIKYNQNFLEHWEKKTDIQSYTRSASLAI